MDTKLPGKRLNLSVQYTCGREGLPTRSQILSWARAALKIDGTRGGQITLRFVDSEEGRTLNRDYRGKDYATNILSFPYESAPLVCGDLVICVPVVLREAAEQGKALEAHYAHLVVHGILHLQGYDHESGKKAAQKMENLECTVLAALGYDNPYAGEQ